MKVCLFCSSSTPMGKLASLNRPLFAPYLPRRGRNHPPCNRSLRARLRARSLGKQTFSERDFPIGHFPTDIFRFRQFLIIYCQVQTFSDSDIFRPDIFLPDIFRFFKIFWSSSFETFSDSDIFRPDIFLPDNFPFFKISRKECFFLVSCAI